MAAIQERYNPRVIGVNTTVTLTTQALGGFLVKTSGTITVVDAKGTTVVDAVPVTAGIYVPLPFYLQGNGGTFTTAGGASGTLAT
jgi:hypothetical protein